MLGAAQAKITVGSCFREEYAWSGLRYIAKLVAAPAKKRLAAALKKMLRAALDKYASRGVG